MCLCSYLLLGLAPHAVCAGLMQLPHLWLSVIAHMIKSVYNYHLHPCVQVTTLVRYAIRGNSSAPYLHHLIPRQVVFKNTILEEAAQPSCLSPLATDAACQLDVLRHDGHTLGVDGAQVGVLEQTHQVGLSSLLQSQHCGALEAQVGLEVLSNLTDQALEGQLPDQQLSGLLVLPDLTQGHGTGPVAMGLLHTTGGGGGLASCLGGQLLPGGLATSGLTSGLLGTSHGSRC